MQGELERLGEPSDRERRERLEQVQAELRTARLELTHADDSAARRLAEVQASVDAAKARRKSARVRAKALEAETLAGEERVEQLQRQLAEAELLAEGARQRGYRDWLTPASMVPGAVWVAICLVLVLGYVLGAMAPRPGFSPGEVIAGFLGLIVLVGLPFWVERKRRRRK